VDEEFWHQARHSLDGLPAGGLNIAHEAVDRHVAHGRGDVVALRCLAADETVTEVTYGELAERTSRFANLLDGLDVAPGDAVFSLLGRQPETFVTALGTLKHRSVFCPLFAAFGPGPVRERLRLGSGRVLVTTHDLYQRRVVPVAADLPDLRHVLLVDPPAAGITAADGEHDVLSLPDLLAAAADHYEIGPTDPETPSLLHFTSGTTGRPKGALHAHEAVVAHHATASYALGLRAGDVFWCTADPGWVTGTSYGIIAPLTHGVTLVCDAGDFSTRGCSCERAPTWHGSTTSHGCATSPASASR
jgi:acetyl-CoA synthetase